MSTRRTSGEMRAADVERLYTVEGRSIEAVAELLGWSPSAVRSQLVRLGIARRTPWASNAVTCDVDELRRLYEQGLTMTAIAAQVGCSLTTVWRKLTAAGVVARPAAPVHARADFSGDLAEQAYLVGFRQGDLHVVWESASTVVVKCTSTRVEQVALFRALFERYGHVFTDEATLARRARQSIGMEVRLNRSFAFLVPKADALPDWVADTDQTFFAFLAGYIDAEGYIKVGLPRGYRTLQARLEVRSYDANLLHALASGLNARSIPCPAAGIRVRAGYENRYGVRSNGVLWGFGVSRKESLARLFAKLDPYLQHGRRRRDMLKAWDLVDPSRNT